MNRLTCFCMAVLTLLSFYLFSDECYEYENFNGRESYTTHLYIVPFGSGYKIDVQLIKERLSAVLDKDHMMISFRFMAEKKKIDLNVIKNNTSIEMSGIYNNSPVKKSFRIDDAPWCQFFEHSFVRFITSEESRFQFWIFVGYHQTMYKMEAKKIGIETLTIAGKPEEAVHLEVRPLGVYSLLYHYDLWFRKSDGSYLQYEAIEGIGEPLTITRLKSITINNTDK